jgi:rhomboid protease GluP
MPDSQRKSILCPNCRRLISGDEPRCPHCGTANPGSWWKNNLWTKSILGQSQIIKTIIYVNVGMYIVSLLLNPTARSLSLSFFSFLAPSDQSLVLLGATGTIPIDRFHRWWSLVSANYLHGGILHILFNMIALRQIGPLILQEYGTNRMIIIYTLSGVIGFYVSYVAGVALTIGASAAICGLIGAALYYGKSRGGVYGSVIYRQVGGWAIAIFVFGFLVPGINTWGHGGGIVAGALLGFLFQYQEKRRENLFHKLLAGACVAVTVVVLGYAIATSIYYRAMG